MKAGKNMRSKAKVITANDDYYDVLIHDDDGYVVCTIDCGTSKAHAEEIVEVINQKAILIR